MIPVLDADCIGKKFGTRSVLSSASLRVYEGQITALLGRNGVGKSTLLKICAGWLPADFGRLCFGGEMIERPRLHLLARRGLRYLPGDVDLFSSSFTLRRQLDAIASARSSDDLAGVVDTFELTPVLDRMPRSLSSGEQRRASLAVTWLLSPRCLLADEPLRGIDPLDQERFLAVFRRLAERGCAIVLTGHHAELLLDHVDQVVWMTEGTTYRLGTPEDARRDWRFRREYLGIAPLTRDQSLIVP